MAFLEWKEKMNVGNDALDADHKKLVGLLNDLHDIMSGIPDPSMVERILDQMVDFAEYHFEFEEKLLKLCKYPDLDAHKEIHKGLLDDARRMRDAYHNRPTEFQLVTTFDFLSGWLMKHILREDMAYRPFIQRKIRPA